MAGERVSWKLFLLISVLGFSLSAQADDTAYKLVYRFVPGQFSHYEVQDQAEILTQYGQDQVKSIQQTQMLKQIRVVAVDGRGGATLEPIVEAVRMASQAGDKPVVSFDSSKDQTPPKEFERIAGTIGRPLARFQVTSNGRLTSVTMLATDVPKHLTEAAQKADPTMNFLVVLHENPVKVGEKWTEKSVAQVSVGSGLNQPVNLIRSYELTGVSGNIATISYRTSLLTPVTDPEILRQLLQLTPSGAIEFDIQQGRIASKTIKIDEKVVGAFGAQSLLQAQGESKEKLVPSQLTSAAPAQLPK